MNVAVEPARRTREQTYPVTTRLLIESASVRSGGATQLDRRQVLSVRDSRSPKTQTEDNNAG